MKLLPGLKQSSLKTLYVTDLDGTLLNSHDKISSCSIEIINSLVEQGMFFTYATARSLVSASVVAEGLTTQMPLIVYNGAFIIDAATGNVLAKEGFTKEETDRVVAALQEYDISPMVYSYIDNVEKVSWLTDRENDGIRRYLSRRKGDRRFRPLTEEVDLYAGDIFYFTCIGEKEPLQPIYDLFSRNDSYTCTLQQELYSSEYFCEIMPKKATKANAIRKLKELLHCDRVVSFGDAINDIPMFQISDECYAVENAVEELKSLATGIIGSNDNDGVALWLKENAVFSPNHR